MAHAQSVVRPGRLALAAALVFTCAMPPAPSSVAAQPAHPSEVLPRERWPSFARAAVTDILSKMKEDEKVRVRETNRSDLVMFQDSWGAAIRNHYGLWRGNQALILSACGEPCHPDEASMVIIEAVWVALQAK
jgi:hypothetical protein